MSRALIRQPTSPVFTSLARSLHSVDLFPLLRLADMICERFCLEKTSVIGFTACKVSFFYDY